MLFAWFVILVIPASAQAEESRPSSSTDSRDNLSSLYDQTVSACGSTTEIENLLEEQLSPEDRAWRESNEVFGPEDVPEDWTEGQHWRERRDADYQSNDVHYLPDNLDPKRGKPSFNSWGGKRISNFHSWGGKRSSEDIETDLEAPIEETKRADPIIYLKFADALSTSNGGFKRKPAFNSWGGKRSGPAFNSWGGKRGPAFNSWGGKRGPAFNSWGGKRSPAFNSWGGKRDSGPAFNSWGGKRGPAFNSWGGKRSPAFNSWGGKRGPAFNSWGGKRGPAFNSWGGKRSPAFNSWGGKRGPAFNSWGGKRGAQFNSWGGKRGAQFNSWGGKRGAQFNSWGGKRDSADLTHDSSEGKRGSSFHSWGGKRSLDFNDNEVVHENVEDSTDILPEITPELNEETGTTEQFFLQKRETEKSTDAKSTSSENNHNLRKREIRETSKEQVLPSGFSQRDSDTSERAKEETALLSGFSKRETGSSDPKEELVLPSLEAAEKLYHNYKEREKKCSELKSRLNGERIRYLMNYILNLRLSGREPEEKKSVIHKMLLRAADYSPDGSTFNQARRGAEFHSWGGKRSDSSFGRYE